MHRYVSQNWCRVAAPEIFMHDEGYYVIKFQSLTDMHEIYYAGPYTINNRPFILKPWTPNFDFSVEFPSVIPLWVKFYNLPKSCWGVDSLSRIASVIGHPVYADECTAKQTRISYARMLIEVNVTKPLPCEITVMDQDGKPFTQDVSYDWKPLFCEVCQVIGHKCEAQVTEQHRPQRRKPPPKRTAQEWKSKSVTTTEKVIQHPIIQTDQQEVDIKHGSTTQRNESNTSCNIRSHQGDENSRAMKLGTIP